MLNEKCDTSSGIIKLALPYEEKVAMVRYMQEVRLLEIQSCDRRRTLTSMGGKDMRDLQRDLQHSSINRKKAVPIFSIAKQVFIESRERFSNTTDFKS